MNKTYIIKMHPLDPTDAFAPSTVLLIPEKPFRITNIQIDRGWDIEYVLVADVILSAFRYSVNPLCTPEMKIQVSILPWRFACSGPAGEEKRILAYAGEVTVTIEGIEYS